MSLTEVVKIFNKHKYLGRKDWHLDASLNGLYPGKRKSTYVCVTFALQIAERLIKPIAPINTLPGAERFYAHLCSLHPGKTVIVEAPLVGDRSYDMDYSKHYKVIVEGRIIGEYRTFGPKPGYKHFTREYSGEIPGYVNEAIIIANKGKGKKRPVNRVSLVWDNGRFEAQDFNEGPGRLVATKWQRQDGHDEIPFP